MLINAGLLSLNMYYNRSLLQTSAPSTSHSTSCGPFDRLCRLSMTGIVTGKMFVVVGIPSAKNENHIGASEAKKLTSYQEI